MSGGVAILLSTRRNSRFRGSELPGRLPDDFAKHPVELTDAVESAQLETDLTVGYLDNVDEINIAEGNLLAVETMFHVECLADVKVNFVLGGSLEDSWDVIAGEEIYECLNEISTFWIDGTGYTRAANGALGDSGYYLLGDAENRKFVFSDKSALAQG